MSSFAGRETAADSSRTDVAIAIIIRSGKVLICQRRPGGAFAGYWEFPGGKREPNETMAECVTREVFEELAIRAAPLVALRPIDHDYPAGHIRLHPFVCRSEAGHPQPLACQAVKWIDPPDLRIHPFPPANESLIDEVIEYVQNGDHAADGRPAAVDFTGRTP